VVGFSQNIAVNDAIKRGRNFLIHVQKNDGAISDTLNPLFETWETVLAATALYDTKKDTNEITFKKALSFLRKNENINGLVCHNKKCKEAYCLETTAQYFLLLIRMGLKEKIKPRLEFIKELQKPTGEWEIGNPDVKEIKDFPSVTAFILQLFTIADIKPKYEKEAYQWLISKQNEARHWGNAWEYYNCPAYTIWPALQIKTTHTGYATAKEKVSAYILKSQYKNGSWNYIDLAINKGPSAELQTALMISSLENYPATKNKEQISKGIVFLLSKQTSNGSWDGGDFPIKNERYQKKEYVFATALSLIVLEKQKNK
jgi:squalene cyclase